MEKLFVTGGSGLLGSNILKLVPKKFEVFGSFNKNKIFFKNISLLKIDLSDKKQINVIKELKPDCIIHCAALVNLDECEKNPENAYKQNVVSTENIVNVTEEINCFLIHISTDAVYDGTKGNYSEIDKPNPINVYGNTKLEAEEIIKTSNIEYCIVRTNIYGWNIIDKFSLAEWMIDRLENGEELPAFRDIQFTPILVNNLAQALFNIYDNKIQGILNVSGSQSCSKFEFARNIADIFHFNKNLIKPVNIDEIKLIARRGKNLSLNTQKAQSLLETKLFNVKEGLHEMKRLREIGYVNELKGLCPKKSRL